MVFKQTIIFVGGIPGRMAAAVPADGNCLFNALSVAIVGNVSLATELRVRTCIEMVENGNHYLKKHKQSGIDLVSPDYKVSMHECATSGKFSSAWTLSAASVMLNTRIVSVYPPVNGLMDKTISILNTTFVPQKESISRRAPLFIMCSSVTPPSLGTWTPNPFVPLLLREKPATIDLRSPSKETYADATRHPNTSTPNKQVRKIFILSFYPIFSFFLLNSATQ